LLNVIAQIQVKATIVKNFTVQTAFIIDDSEVDLFVQKKFIELRHFAGEVVTFNSPTQALEVLGSPTYKYTGGLVFLDLNMPLINGFEFLDKAREMSTGIFNRMKVVILSSSNSKADQERAMSFKNVITFISKPLTIESLDSLRGLVAEGDPII